MKYDNLEFRNGANNEERSSRIHALESHKLVVKKFKPTLK